MTFACLRMAEPRLPKHKTLRHPHPKRLQTPSRFAHLSVTAGFGEQRPRASAGAHWLALLPIPICQQARIVRQASLFFQETPMSKNILLYEKTVPQLSDTPKCTVLDKIIRFVRDESTQAEMHIELYASDEEARANGWSSATAHRQEIMDIIQTLPIDVRLRVKIGKRE